MRVALGVGGGIAAYKSAELARALAGRDVQVQVVMTAAARQFVQPLTFAALTGRKVITDLFPASDADESLSSAVEHIGVAQANDLLVVAPATADLMAKFAHGLADDFLSTMYLAFTGPVVLAPAMNNNMWRHPATQANLQVLRQRGHVIVGPDEGALACGTVGPGRMSEPEAIADAVLAVLNIRRDLEGETVLITAGPTQEPLDPVRYISNRSSGKMGYALAEAAAARGARVLLVSGPVHIPEPPGVTLTRVRTAREMRDAVFANLEPATIVIKAAAVADYHVASVPQQKLKKTAARISLELDPTPDILAELGSRKGDRLLIGFAAETENLRQEARRKLQSKNCDMIAGNLVGQEGTGFESDTNEVVLALATGAVIALPRATKREIADRIFDEALKLRLALHAAQ
jgi:phosphopantothenoylcysteine decarboxylase/phosphopantothenate--cysteine ligase